MGGRHFLAKSMATIAAFLLVNETTPATSELPSNGCENKLAAVGIGGRATSVVGVKKEEGKFPISTGISMRSLRSNVPSPPPPPFKNRAKSMVIVTPPPPPPPLSNILIPPPPPTTPTPPKSMIAIPPPPFPPPPPPKSMIVIPPPPPFQQ